jgi:hypothetical protein
MSDAPIHIPHPVPTLPPVESVTPTLDKLGFWESAVVVYADGSIWTIEFPEYPTISPISFTEKGKPAFTVTFSVDVDSFTFTASYNNVTKTVSVQATGFPKWDVTTDGYKEEWSTFPDLISAVYTPFSKTFPSGLIGNVSLLRDTCAKARAVMMPANVDVTDQGDSYLTAAVAMNLIPPTLQINVENLGTIATVAEAVMTTEPISYPLTTATDFFFGTAPGVYATLLNALAPYFRGEGSNPSPIPEPMPVGDQPPKPPKPVGIKGH